MSNLKWSEANISTTGRFICLNLLQSIQPNQEPKLKLYLTILWIVLFPDMLYMYELTCKHKKKVKKQ